MTDDCGAVARLVYGYAERLDSGDLEGVATLFAAASLRSNQRANVHRGHAQVLSLFRDTVLLYDGLPGTKHVITNLVVDLASDASAATSRCDFTVLQARPELPLQPVLAGRYHDRFTRGEGAWHFADRLILVDFVGNLRWHARRAVAPR